jgi:hypothetical protein
VHVASIYYVGKDSNFLEEVEYGLLHDPDEVQQKYLDPREDTWSLYIVPVLKDMRRKAEIAQLVGVRERSIQFLRNRGMRRPSRTVRAKLTQAAGCYAREQLGPNAPADDLAACAAFIRHRNMAATNRTSKRRKATHVRGSCCEQADMGFSTRV